MPLLNIDPMYKLGKVEAVLAKIFSPAPSRPTIVGWIEEGILEGHQIGRGDNYYVYQSSLDKFILKYQKPQKLAA